MSYNQDIVNRDPVDRSLNVFKTDPFFNSGSGMTDVAPYGWNQGGGFTGFPNMQASNCPFIKVC
jgi:hypothetical protein